MNELYPAREANEWTARLRQAAPFVVIRTASILVGGLMAGAIRRLRLTPSLARGA